ncbi:MAG: DNA polymerase III subunit alpha [Spirochaetae bacterium HGW-Spirochaetae-1]|jgi:DNA polymerase-3 subunit alpha|nr:MAG: DNA polymerase III subunit alpha [Spirochaetae bacterium HGW-Spirochaetae-1]
MPEEHKTVMEFIHLHNHSDYSLLDGAITVGKLVKKAIDMGMPAIALTDHGNMFGAIEFYQKARKAGITPIIGQEFYMAPGSRLSKEFVKDSNEEKSYHLLLLAKNEKGYKNLLKLSSIGYTEGFYYKPRIDMEMLVKHSEGLICGSACLAGQIPRHIMKGQLKEARDLAGTYSEIFGRDNFYLELQDHGIPEQVQVNRELVAISSELNIPLIATNDAHYVNREDAYSHEILLCIQTGKTMKDENRMRFPGTEFYLKSGDEMRTLFAELPDAIYNTHKIFEMIDLTLDLGNPILPNFDVPQGYNLDSYLRHLVFEGVEMRYGKNVPEAVIQRIEYELTVITNMHFSGYFLIVWDFIKEARRMQIPVGPGRGSAAGSMVSFCLGITALDPLKYDLLFERFLNPDRNEMPDMDLDFCADRREEVIDYVKQKYGEDKVSQIITFNKMKAKLVVKDVARVMDIPFARANEISKMIAENTLQESLNKSPELQKLYKSGDVEKELIDISLRLEGLARSAGKHAAGVVISKGALTEYVPLYMEPKEGSISSQYEKNTLEQAGLVKMDFLGLKNLTVIDKCLKLIKKNTGLFVDIETIPLDDKATFGVLQRAETVGVFQLESSGMQNLLRRLGPTVFDDIIAVVALYRPGPLGSGMADDFVKRKRTPSLVKYEHPLLESILKDTLGVIIYQEQVMLISQVIGGFTMPEADKLRKAMGKKKMDIINELEEKFLAGAANNKIDKSFAEELYGQIKKFGEYGFNKSHSAAYALVTYQTAYLKAHYSIQYMTALLSTQPDDVTMLINDCRRMGIEVLPPSINKSMFDFTIEGKKIRFGFSAIKGLGEKAIENIIKTREQCGTFNTLKDFFENISLLTVNKGVLEALVKAGAFEDIHKNRAQLFASIELLIDTARKLQEDKASGQGNLFSLGEGTQASVDIDLLDVAEWKDNERLLNEKEVLGLYVSGHPLARFEDEIRSFSSTTIGRLAEENNESDVSIVGVIHDFTVKRSQKSGKKYATGFLEDLEGTIELLAFARVVEKNEDLLMSNQPVMVSGKIEMDGDVPKKIIVNSVRALKDVRREAISAIHIKLDPIGVDEKILDMIKSTFLRYKGDCPIFFHVNERNDREKIIKVHNTFNITPSEGLVKDLSQILGQESIRYTIGHQ